MQRQMIKVVNLPKQYQPIFNSSRSFSLTRILIQMFNPNLQ